jgi:hypothetical protein
MTVLPPLTIERTPPDPAMERRVPWPVTSLYLRRTLGGLDFFEFSGIDDSFVRDAGGEPTTSKHSILVAITNLNSKNEAIRNIVMYRYYFRCWVAPAKLIIGPNHNFIQTTIHVLTGRKLDNCLRERGRQLYRRWRVLWYEPNTPIHRSVRTIYG